METPPNAITTAEVKKYSQPTGENPCKKYEVFFFPKNKK